MKSDCKYIKLLEQDGLALSMISPSDITYEMCKVAVMQNASAYELCPKQYQTLELAETALNLPW